MAGVPSPPPPSKSYARSTPDKEERLSQRVKEPAVSQVILVHCGSSTLAWKIPWTEEPGRLQSMGWLGVRHD